MEIDSASEKDNLSTNINYNIKTHSTILYYYHETHVLCEFQPVSASGVPRNFVRAGGGFNNSVEDREQRGRGSGGR